MVNYEEMTAEELIGQLERAREYPESALLEAIWQRRAEMEPLLLAVFADSLDDDWEDDPRWYRLIHAGKFLLSWQSLDALPVFTRMYSSEDRRLRNACEWFEEDLVHYGPAAIPYLEQVVRTDTGLKWHYGRGLSCSMLTRIARYYPETRDEITAFFRSQLPAVEDIPNLTEINEMWEVYAAELGVLGDESSKEHILALFEAGKLSEILSDRAYYLRELDEGFRPEQPPEPYDIRKDYGKWYEEYQKHLRQEQKRREAEKRERQARKVSPRSEQKVGRNDPCPCGSGKKYKHCHGRRK